MSRFEEPEESHKSQRSDQSPTQSDARLAEKHSRQTRKCHAAYYATGPQGEKEESTARLRVRRDDSMMVSGRIKL